MLSLPGSCSHCANKRAAHFGYGNRRAILTDFSAERTQQRTVGWRENYRIVIAFRGRECIASRESHSRARSRSSQLRRGGHGAPHYCQTQSRSTRRFGAERFDAKESIEDPGQRLGRNPGACIGDIDSDCLAVSCGCHRHWRAAGTGPTKCDTGVVEILAAKTSKSNAEPQS
jgi:hypothetical protein